MSFLATEKHQSTAFLLSIMIAISAVGLVNLEPSAIIAGTDEAKYVIPCGDTIGVKLVDENSNSDYTGVGTLTFYNPETREFGAFGHTVRPSDTNTSSPLQAAGTLYKADILSVSAGAKGAPGQLHGIFTQANVAIGEVETNTDCGVFGKLNVDFSTDYEAPIAIKMASKGEIHEGGAKILSSIIGGQVQSFDVEIERVTAFGLQHRDMVVRITDERLLERTGGIVQGMSGSPILQNGALVGAITHVFVGDPTRGYGVAAENMNV